MERSSLESVLEEQAWLAGRPQRISARRCDLRGMATDFRFCQRSRPRACRAVRPERGIRPEIAIDSHYWQAPVSIQRACCRMNIDALYQPTQDAECLVAQSRVFKRHLQFGNSAAIELD